MSYPGEILNRNALRDGDVICRRGTALVSKAIMLATGGKWSHDALIIRNPKTGALAIGDAIGGSTDECQITPITEWERGCREDGHRIIVLRPAYATEEQGQRAAAFWVSHIAGQRYDKVAIWRLGLKAIFGDWFSGKVGMSRLDHYLQTRGQTPHRCPFLCNSARSKAPTWWSAKRP